MQTLTFPVESPGDRLDSWLTACLNTALPADSFSRGRVQALIKEHFVSRDGTVEANPSRKTRGGETYTVNIPPPEDTTLVAEDIPLDVLFEDEHLIVINKAVGMAVHPSIGHESGTLVHALLHHCPDLSGINGENRPGIIHRLDKDTSGVMVAAKHDRAHRILARQFAKHSIHRLYYALVRGLVRPPSGTVEGNLDRHPVSRIKRAVVEEGGKPAITHYRTAEALDDRATLLACTLETGRTHQIRVHLAHIGYPLLGDKLYGNPNPMKGMADVAIPRQMLHAAELGFTHPINGEDMAFEAPLPEDMQAVIQFFRQS